MSRLAARHLNIKQRLERIFARDLRRIYSDEARKIAGNIESGIPTDRFHNEQQLKTIIGAHLSRIAKIIDKTEFTETAQKEYNRIMADKMYSDLVNSFNKLANSIIKKDIKEKSKLSIGEDHICLNINFAESDQKKTDWLYFMMLAIPARSLLIANLETQEVYEANNLINSVKKDKTMIPQIVGAAIATGTIYSLLTPKVEHRKIWRSINIPTTRDTHSAADGQEVGLDEPFIVGGEELMYPGDARTATPANYFNCYCTVEYVIK